MRNRGSLILLILALVLVAVFFSLFGFSYDKATRVGQYVAIGVLIFFIIDETFKQN